MFNLQIIRSTKSRNGSYLGITSGFMVEVKDHDPGIRKLLPEGFKFRPLHTPGYRGRKRLILLNYSETCLVMMKTSQTKSGTIHAKLHIYVNNGTESDRDILDLIRILASYRWPSGVLFIAKSSLKKMPKNFPSELLKMGWIDSREGTGEMAFKLQLPKPIHT